MADLPTPECTEELHTQMGGACMFCCEMCNHDAHVCKGCGLGIRHDRRNWPPPNTYHHHQMTGQPPFPDPDYVPPAEPPYVEQPDTHDEPQIESTP